MAHNKRKRAVVLALIAFFCGATAVVSVDWKRFGGGFLALFKSRSDPIVAAAGGGVPPGGAILTALAGPHPKTGPQFRLNAPASHRHSASVAGRSGGHKSDEDLFTYGDPAAGGMPAGSFVVARNDAPGAGPAPLIEAATPTEIAAGGTSAGGEGGGVTSSAPAPNIGFGGGGGIVVTSPSPPPSNGTPPPATSTPGAPPPPTQSGTSDNSGNGDGNGDGNGNGDPTSPIVTSPTPPPSSPVPPPVPPVSAVPEASNAAMMGLGALFLAVAASRRRKNDAA